ncbi:alpha/beta hydrolase [Amycolatopsis sp. cg13]|uniref:alpha/beta hydrolase n=1 Tax=Amycolatopsis sp. cg13 TaxID=3238807 RepID=UPI003523CA7E
MPLEPESAQFVEALAAEGDPPLHESTPAIARMGDMVAAGLTGRGPDVGSVTNLKLDGKNGRFRVRILAPAEPSRGVLVYFHGGGWVLGDIDLQYDFVGRDLVNRTQCTVVLVNYRKAPEHPFPTALEDSFAALAWVSENVHQQGPLIVAGDSAGGNIAAVMTRWARDKGGPAVDGQVLIYPVTDCDLDRPSYLDPANHLLIDRDAMRWFWNHYLPDEASRTDPDASPLRAANLSGLPPALVYTAQYDPLHDEGVAYADALRAAGVEVTSEEATGEMHGFFQMANIFPGYADGIAVVSRYLSAFVDGFERQA